MPYHLATPALANPILLVPRQLVKFGVYLLCMDFEEEEQIVRVV